VRRLDAAFNALESGSKLPHSIAGRNRRTTAKTVLPHQRDTETGASGWYTRSGDVSVYDCVILGPFYLCATVPIARIHDCSSHLS
jgi:hypothetical protein